MNKILILDGYNLIYRARHTAMKKGENSIGVARGFTGLGAGDRAVGKIPQDNSMILSRPVKFFNMLRMYSLLPQYKEFFDKNNFFTLGSE